MQKTYHFLLLLLQKTHLVVGWLYRWYALMWLCDAAVPDPDLEIREGGGGQSPKRLFFGPFGPQFGLKIRGRAPPALPLDPPVCSSESYVLFWVWLCDCVMQFYSKTHISPLLVIESPVAQWLEHLTSHGSSWVRIPPGARIFSEFPFDAKNESWHCDCLTQNQSCSSSV